MGKVKFPLKKFIKNLKNIIKKLVTFSIFLIKKLENNLLIYVLRVYISKCHIKKFP